MHKIVNTEKNVYFEIIFIFPCPNEEMARFYGEKSKKTLQNKMYIWLKQKE